MTPIYGPSRRQPWLPPLIREAPQEAGETPEPVLLVVTESVLVLDPNCTEVSAF